MQRLTYAALFLVGLYPWVHFYAWFQEHGWHLGPMIDAWYVNAATEGLVWDLTIAALALVVWVAFEIATRRDWKWLLVIPVTMGIGVSAGLPLALLFLAGRRAHSEN